MPKLVLKNTRRANDEIVFEGESVVGRSGESDIVLKDPTVSRRHAIVRPTDDGFLVIDLGSENGTRINNERIASPTIVTDGDLLIFGAVMVEFVEEQKKVRDPTASVRVIDGEISHRKVVSKMSAADELSNPVFEALGAPEQISGTQDGTAEGDEIVRIFSRRMRFLNDLGDVFSKSFDEDALLNFVADELFALTPAAERIVILRAERGDETMSPRLARSRNEGETDIPLSRTLIDEAVSKRSGLLVSDTVIDERYSQLESIQSMKLRSFVGVPMICQDEVYGVIQLDSSRHDTPLVKADMAFTMAIASQVAMSLAYLTLHHQSLERELLERDMVLAREVQRYFLPVNSPEIENLEFATEYRPALAVGGDFYDFSTLPDGRLAIAVGDVSGKGVSAALYVARLSSDLRYHSRDSSNPVEILRTVNEALSADARSGMFVTLALIAIDTETGEFELANAGHPLPLIRRSDGKVVPFGERAGIPLGIDAGAEFWLDSGSLAMDETIYLYSDGVTEAENKNKGMFGEKRLIRALAQGKTCDAMSERVRDALASFRAGGPQSDDITYVIMRRTP